MKLDFADYRVTIAIVSVDLRAGYVRLSASASCLMNIDVDQGRISRVSLDCAVYPETRSIHPGSHRPAPSIRSATRSAFARDIRWSRPPAEKDEVTLDMLRHWRKITDRTDLKCTAWTRRPCSARRFRKPPSRSHISSPSPRFSTHGLHGRHAHADGKTLRGTGRHRRHSHSSRSRKQPRPGRLRHPPHPARTRRRRTRPAVAARTLRGPRPPGGSEGEDRRIPCFQAQALQTGQDLRSST